MRWGCTATQPTSGKLGEIRATRPEKTPGREADSEGIEQKIRRERKESTVITDGVMLTTSSPEKTDT